MSRLHIVIATSLLLALLLAPTNVQAESKCILKALEDTPELSSLLEAVNSVPGLADALSDEGAESTVFAPNNQAFEDLMSAGLPSGVELGDILKYHVVPGVKMAADLSAGDKLPTILSDTQRLTVVMTCPTAGVAVEGGGNDGKEMIIQADIKVCNSVVHIIDGVLLPQTSF